MPSTFPGFSPKAITFLRQLKKNNTREWFQPRKDQFEELLRQPMLELATIILDHLRSFAVDHVIEAKKAVPRIYRDVRFSADKSPYKTSIGARFYNYKVHRTAGAGYYVNLSGEALSIAGGIYMPGPAELAAVRAQIAAHPVAFRKIVENPKLTKIAGALLGKQLTRAPKSFPADHPAVDLLVRQQFYFRTSLPVATATSPGVEKLLIKHYKAMSPAVEYMNGILLKAQRSDEDDERPARPKPMF